MKRKIEKQLIEWKSNPNHMSLVVLGAKHIGKTHSILKFAEQNYSNIIYLNFITNPLCKKIFEGNLDFQTIKNKISLIFRTKKIEKGQTVLIIDEIQECPQAITALKFLSIDKTLDVIVSGSLFAVGALKTASFPVGYIESIQMYPLDFEEFLWANDVNETLIEDVRKCFEDKTPVHPAFHRIMNEHLRNYIVIGGMPEAVQKYLDTKNYSEVMKIQQTILKSYKTDIINYVKKKYQSHTLTCFDAVSCQLKEKNKKFKYRRISDNGRSTIYEYCLDWLVDNHMFHRCKNLTDLLMPLIAYSASDKFKIYFADIGLFIATLGEDVQTEILLGEWDLFNGGILESTLADMLGKKGNMLRYYQRKSSLVEFILERQQKLVGITLFQHSKSKNLSTLLKNQLISTGVVFTMENLSSDKGIIKYPLYMAIFF